MSSLRAIELPTQRLERLRPLASPTEAYALVTGPRVPVWAQRVEHAIRVTTRLGFSPTPSILLISAITVGCTIRR